MANPLADREQRQEEETDERGGWPRGRRGLASGHSGAATNWPFESLNG